MIVDLIKTILSFFRHSLISNNALFSISRLMLPSLLAGVGTDRKMISE